MHVCNFICKFHFFVNEDMYTYVFVYILMYVHDYMIICIHRYHREGTEKWTKKSEPLDINAYLYNCIYEYLHIEIWIYV
jgi:hypothetical protein